MAAPKPIGSSIRRSDSSKFIRTTLGQQYIQIPPVLNTVPIDKYFKLLEQTFKSLEFSLQRADLSAQYISLKKICLLAMEYIPKHNAYRSPANKKLRLWCERLATNCFSRLEHVVTLMDEAEDNKREQEYLIDEFDSDETSLSVAQAYHSPECKLAPVFILNEDFKPPHSNESSLLPAVNTIPESQLINNNSPLEGKSIDAVISDQRPSNNVVDKSKLRDALSVLRMNDSEVRETSHHDIAAAVEPLSLHDQSQVIMDNLR
jgi:hypothetical protein